MPRAATRLAGALLFFGAVVCWLTWPLAARLGSHLPAAGFGSTFDLLYTGWVLAWETHALGTAPGTLLDANIYRPTPHALLYGPPALGAVPYFAAVFGATGNPTLALNLLFLGSVTLGATFVHLVTRRWTGMAAAGLVAAATFLASRWLFVDFAVTSPQFAVVFYLPLIVDRLCRPLHDRRGMLALFLLLLAQGLAEVVYLAPAALLPTLVITGARLARGRTRAEGLRLLGVVGLVVLVLAAVHWPWLTFARRTPGLAGQSFWVAEKDRAVDLPWDLVGGPSPVAVPTLALGLIALGASKALVRRRRGTPAARDRLWKHAALWATVGTVISLRPQVRWNGTPVTLLPGTLARSWLPALSFVRAPERLAVAGWVGLALLAGLASAELAAAAGGSARTRVLRGVLAGAVALGIYVQYARAILEPTSYGSALPAAYPLQAAIHGDSRVLGVLRASGGPTLELPIHFSQPTKPEYHAVPMFRSVFHWQPLLNGYASYWPRDFPELMALAARLPDPDALRELERRTGLRFMLVRLAHEVTGEVQQDYSRNLWRELAEHRDRSDLELVAADDELMLFRVSRPPSATTDGSTLRGRARADVLVTPGAPR